MDVLTVGNMYPPHHLGGYELVWQSAVRALRDAGHRVRVLTTGTTVPGAEETGEDPDVHRELRWYWRDHEFPRLSAPARLRLERHNHAVLARHLGEVRPQVVSWWAMGGMSLSLVERIRRAGVPAVGWVNDDWLIYAPQVDQWVRAWDRRPWAVPVVETLTRVPARVSLGDAARWVFCSDAIRRSAIEARGALPDTAVLHQGVPAMFEAAPEQPWRGRLLYVGRIDERKGLRTLVEAVIGLPDMTLRVVGDGEAALAEALGERAAAAGAGDRVAFEPGVPRARLPERYAEADAVVFPVEWFEPWGLVPLEAMAVGRPVIATGQGGSCEYLEPDGNAVLYPPGDVDALRAAIRRVADDAQLRSRLRDGGFGTARRLTEDGWTRAVVAEHERYGRTPRADSTASTRSTAPSESGSTASSGDSGSS